MRPLSRTATAPLIQQALREDAVAHDVTSCATLSAALRIRARIVARAPGILAGGPLALWTLKMVDPSLRCHLARAEGSILAKNSTVLTVTGKARSIFAAERVALNLVSHLSGIATLTRAFVEQTRPYRVRIYDTRKTLPGLRLPEKYAVRVGGGQNHRMGLQDAILIKTNHLKAALSTQHSALSKNVIRAAVAETKRVKPRKFVEIEVTNLEECYAALQARPNAILLDNWKVSNIRKAVQLRDTLHASRFTQLEVSGGVTLANIRAIAKTGVDRISIGRLTHSAPSLDLSLEVVE